MGAEYVPTFDERENPLGTPDSGSVHYSSSAAAAAPVVPSVPVVPPLAAVAVAAEEGAGASAFHSRRDHRQDDAHHPHNSIAVNHDKRMPISQSVIGNHEIASASGKHVLH